MTSNITQYESIKITNLLTNPQIHAMSSKKFYICNKYKFNCENINCSLNKNKSLNKLTIFGEVYFCSELCLNTTAPDFVSF